MQTELRRISSALDRHAQGQFGICCRCHESMDLARPRADPSNPLCLDCVEEQRAERE